MELIPFATLTLATGSEGFYMLGPTPAGTRIIQEIHSAELVGERITASAVGASSADWLAIDAQAARAAQVDQSSQAIRVEQHVCRLEITVRPA